MEEHTTESSAVANSEVYRCLATIGLPATDVTNFDGLVCQSMHEVFTSSGWELMLPLTLEPLAGDGPLGGKAVLFNVWQIVNYSSLASVMAKAADSTPYSQANQLVDTEAQTLYRTLPYNDPIDAIMSAGREGFRASSASEPSKMDVNHSDVRVFSPNTYPTYMVEHLSMTKNTTLLQGYLNYMANAVYTMNWDYQWGIALGVFPATGDISKYVNIWGLTTTSNFPAALAAYRGDSNWSQAIEYVETSMWSLRDVPCFEG